MQRIWTLTATAAAVAAMACVARGQRAALEPAPALPTFHVLDHALVIETIDLTGRLALAEPGNSRHTFSFDGRLEPDANVDVVAATRDLRALRVYDAGGVEMLPPPRGRSSQKISLPDEFNANLEGKIDTELAKTQLVAPVWTARSMDVEAVLLVALKRGEHPIPAAVMEEPMVVGGIELRVDRLTMSADRRLQVSMHYNRGADGPGPPFIEAVYAIDRDGVTLGGGRWTEGSPLKSKGKLVFAFPLEQAQYHSGFRIIICSESEMRPLTFTLTGLFD